MSASTSERVHGGLDAAELARLGLSPSQVVDFSVNINPYGPCEPVLAALAAARLDVYPDARGEQARARWAERLAVPSAGIAVAHGASDLFWAVARACLAPGDHVLIAEPTFSEFRVAAEACGARVERYVAPGSALRLDLQALAACARSARALYLCAPNNPTGEYVGPDAVADLAAQLPDTWIVLDQSFLALSDHAADERVALPSNVIRVRSLTKDLALPGLRIGMLVGHPDHVRRIEAMRPTWPTSAPALAAIAAAAHAEQFVRASYARMRADRERVAQLFRAHGYPVLPSATTFSLVRVGAATAFRAALLPHGVSVRDCSSFGLAEHVRVAALPATAQSRLAGGLEALSRERPDLRDAAAALDR